MNTRIAPSPSGYFHIGTARTAYFNWLVAKATGGKFLLRIDDTDASRSNDDYIKVIIDCLDWLGLNPDYIVRQSDDLSIYIRYAVLLVNNGKAYFSDNDAIILKNAADFLPDKWTDSIKGDIFITDTDKDNINGLVLIRGDGTPTYNFASIIDDCIYGIDQIIRGVDHINNTPKQIAILKALNLWNDQITFTHVGLIHDMNGKKVSKRDGAKSVLDYKADNIKSEALLNLLLRCGWSPKEAAFDSKYKTIPKDLAIDLIRNNAGNFRAAPSKFDIAKLSWYNKRY